MRLARQDYPLAGRRGVAQYETMCAEIDKLREDIVQERHLGQLMFFAQQRWQSMAEDLWEELQEWHAPDCNDVDERGNRENCICHALVASLWDNLTHADDWAAFAEEADA